MKKSEINILVVEDDNALRAGLMDTIKKMGYGCVPAAKPDEALAALKIKPIHAALIDCLLPKKNGVELVKDLRESSFKDAKVILMSGVFKDKVFEQESIAKTGAVAFLSKPFEISSLKKILDQELDSLIETGEVPLNVLISRPYATVRERIKVIESLSEIQGHDLPFVLSIILDSQIQGHLNIVNEAGEIFGISVRDGRLVGVDSGNSLANLSMLLVQQGYLSLEDLKTVEVKGTDKDFLELLVTACLISPHSVPEITKINIQNELKRLFIDQKLKINFVSEKIKIPSEGIDWADMADTFYQVLMNDIPVNYLESFYKDWLEFPIRLSSSYVRGHKVFNFELLKKLPDLVSNLDQSPTLEELTNKKPELKESIFRAVHILTLFKQIIFDDVKKVKNFEQQIERMKIIQKDLQGKNPFEVFSYFGVKETSRIDDVTRVYKDFAWANHPDKLPANISVEAHKIFNNVFAILSEAHDVLTNDIKRQKFIVDLKQKEAEKQIRAEALAEEGMVKLRKGKVVDALKDIEEAQKIFTTRTIRLYWHWVRLKARANPKVVKEILTEMEAMSHVERRDALYQHIMGLVRKAQGDIEGAAAHFDKAIYIHPEFADARKELTAIEGERKTKKSDSLLTGDITGIVSGLFKRKVK